MCVRESVLTSTSICTSGDLRKWKCDHQVTLGNIIKMKCCLWGLVLQNVLLTEKRPSVEATHGKRMEVGPSVTWDHPHDIHLGHSSCSGLHIRAAKNTPVRATKIPTSHYPRSWRFHVSEGSKRNEYLWVWWPHLVQREAREIMPPSFLLSLSSN